MTIQIISQAPDTLSGYKDDETPSCSSKVYNLAEREKKKKEFSGGSRRSPVSQREEATNPLPGRPMYSLITDLTREIDTLDE